MRKRLTTFSKVKIGEHLTFWDNSQDNVGLCIKTGPKQYKALGRIKTVKLTAILMKTETREIVGVDPVVVVYPIGLLTGIE